MWRTDRDPINIIEYKRRGESRSTKHEAPLSLVSKHNGSPQWRQFRFFLAPDMTLRLTFPSQSHFRLTSAHVWQYRIRDVQWSKDPHFILCDHRLNAGPLSPQRANERNRLPLTRPLREDWACRRMHCSRGHLYFPISQSPRPPLP